MSLILNNKSYLIELKHNEFVPAFDNKFYLPLISLQYTYIKLQYNNWLIKNSDSVNVKLIFYY